MVIVLIGAAGAGKTTIGRGLAAQLGWSFVDADDYHEPANIEKMRRGQGLSDAERAAWLQALHDIIAAAVARREHIVVACSALKERYRDVLAGGLKPIRFIYLTAPPTILQERLSRRESHFAGPALLASQLAVLEEPTDMLSFDTSGDPATTIAGIRSELGL
jgi:gluconokinase